MATLLSTSIRPVGEDVDMVPVNWRWERFTIVDAGQGRIALHNGVSNCFLKMSDSGMVFSPHKDQNALPSHWESEFFEVIGVGEGMVALWNKHRKRFVNMSPSGDVGRSRERPDKTLQDGWSWEKFYLVTVRPYLEPGTTVALYNTRNRKFLRMNLKGSTYIVDFSPESDGSRPDGWEKEWFRVDDAGNGMIALWSTKYKNYVMMEHEWLRAAGGIDIWERFVAISPPGSMETALWNPFHQSTIDTFTGAPKRGYPGTLQDLPGNNRYTWKVIVKPPS
ncbi:unnamed protein product [Symbiodinium sp. CCMP2592]|nr:unnamed protein product [Symbiodinium sp. CCMP2592]